MVPFAKNSLLNGLELLIDVESYDYAVSSTDSEGIIMSILYQLDIPIMKNTGINLEPGLNEMPILYDYLFQTSSFLFVFCRAPFGFVYNFSSM